MSGARALHLAQRFVGSLSPGEPAPADRAWVAANLSEDEMVLWVRMSAADRRHAVGVARRVQQALGEDASRPVVAAALLHDVGKVVCGLGTFGRVMATVAPMTSMAGSNRLATRFGQYLAHDRLGGDLLEQAGSDPLTVAWAREHHRPPEGWTVPAATGRALKAADDD
ncbi:MAG TPA: HD domain-containing protein [Acidimicrobiales bacterium]|nr:HD domain-containing protein [Acidimicrobiales bacterium]